MKKPIPNEYLLTATSYGTDATTLCLNFRRESLLWFFQSLTVGYTLPEIIRQRATIAIVFRPYGSPSFALQSSIYFC